MKKEKKKRKKLFRKKKEEIKRKKKQKLEREEEKRNKARLKMNNKFYDQEKFLKEAFKRTSVVETDPGLSSILFLTAFN